MHAWMTRHMIRIRTSRTKVRLRHKIRRKSIHAMDVENYLSPHKWAEPASEYHIRNIHYAYVLAFPTCRLMWGVFHSLIKLQQGMQYMCTMWSHGGALNQQRWSTCSVIGDWCGWFTAGHKPGAVCSCLHNRFMKHHASLPFPTTTPHHTIQLQEHWMPSVHAVAECSKHSHLLLLLRPAHVTQCWNFSDCHNVLLVTNESSKISDKVILKVNDMAIIIKWKPYIPTAVHVQCHKVWVSAQGEDSIGLSSTACPWR